MRADRHPRAGLALAIVCSLVPAVALAAPARVNLTPPDGTRVLAGQRFDLRVEGQGTGPFSATLSIDGQPVTFTSGEQNSLTTDGISAAGWGGFNARGYSSSKEGEHQIVATFTDATGTSQVESKFSVVDPLGGRRPVKNIIIMMGDGMGVAHRTAARVVRYGVTRGDPNGFLAMDTLPSTGLVTTHSLSSFVTDSSPGMSAYVSGTHQGNNQEGVHPANVTNTFFAPRVEYLSEYLHRIKGKVLGLVTTADVEDATPAANAVHTANRNNGTGIVDQYLDESDAAGAGDHGSGLRLLMGGGRRWFLPAGTFGSSRTAATDYPALPPDLVAAWDLPVAGAADPERNLIAGFTAAGFTYVEDRAQLEAVRGRGGPDRLLGLFGYGNMNVALDKLAKRRGTPLPGSTTFVVDDYHAPDQPMLDEMTGVALEVLQRHRPGFLLMVEGAHIDKQSHAMDAERTIDDTIEFDRAVAVARTFAARTRDTLLIVVADHECAGFSVIGGLINGIAALRALPPDNTVLDPAIVPERQKVIGIYDGAGFPRYNILPDGYPETLDVDGKLLVGYGASADRYETWLTKPLPITDALLSNDIKAELAAKGYFPDPVDRVFERERGFYLRGQAAGRTQAVHTAADVPISAFSAIRDVHQQFVGVQRNTDVFFKLARAVLGGY